MNFIDRHFRVLALFALLATLVSAHAFMIHAGRAREQIEWAENLISGCEGALVVLLSKGPDEGPPK